MAETKESQAGSNASGVVEKAKQAQALAKQARDARFWFKLLFSGENSRITTVTGFGLVGVALFFVDIPQIVIEWLGVISTPTVIGPLLAEIINDCITVGAIMTFYTWTKLIGVEYVSPSRIVPFVVAIIVDLIPGTDASILLAFEWTVAISLIVIFTRLEDRTGIGLSLGKLSKGVTPLGKKERTAARLATMERYRREGAGGIRKDLGEGLAKGAQGILEKGMGEMPESLDSEEPRSEDYYLEHPELTPQEEEN